MLGTTDMIFVKPCVCELPTCSQCDVLLTADGFKAYCDTCHEDALKTHRNEVYKEALNEAFDKGFEEVKNRYKKGDQE